VNAMKKICMILAILVFSSCFGKTDIIGKWKVVEPLLFKNEALMKESDYIHFVFSKDNTFLNICSGFSQSGKYSIKDKTIEMIYPDRQQIFEIYSLTSSELILKRKDDGFIMRMIR